MDNPKAVIGTNSWGSAAYEKIIRGSVVDNDTLKEAMKAAAKSNLLFVDSARDYGFGKGQKLIGMCCPDEIKISSKYTPFTRFKPGQVRESVDKDLRDFGRKSIEVYWFALMKKVAERHDMTIPQVAISFVANKGIVPICGCRKPYQVEQLGVAANTKLSKVEMKKLEEVADELNVKILGSDLFRFAVRK